MKTQFTGRPYQLSNRNQGWGKFKASNHGQGAHQEHRSEIQQFLDEREISDGLEEFLASKRQEGCRDTFLDFYDYPG